MSTHVYFDLDGTLTDPFEGISKCIIYAVEKLGFPTPDEDFLKTCIGPPLYDTFPQLVGQDLTLQAVDLYRERFDDVGWRENVPYADVHDALGEIATQGHRLFVATSKPRIAAIRIVEHFGFGEFFERVFGCELDGTHASKTDLLNYAIEENPGDVNRLMIGDRKHDVLGAVANGIVPIGVEYGYGNRKELQSAGAKAIAVTPSDLPRMIAAQYPGRQ